MTINEYHRGLIIEFLSTYGISADSLRKCQIIHRVSVNTIKSIWSLYLTNGSPAPTRKRKRKDVYGSLAHDDLELALQLLKARPDMFMKEVCENIYNIHDVLYSVDAVRYAVNKAGLTRKVSWFVLILLLYIYAVDNACNILDSNREGEGEK